MPFWHQHNPHPDLLLTDTLGQQGLLFFPLPPFEFNTPIFTDGGVFLCLREVGTC